MTRQAGRSIAAAALCLVIGWGGAGAAQDQPKVPGVAWTRPKPINVPPRKPWPPVKATPIQTPLFIGQNREEATRLALASGLRPGFKGDGDARALVVVQSQPEGRLVPRGTEIELTLRDPPQPVAIETVGDYFGQDRRAAFDAVRSGDLQPRFTGANTQDATVARQLPKAQTEVPAGTFVVLVMAAAPTSSGPTHDSSGSGSDGGPTSPNNPNSKTDGSSTVTASGVTGSGVKKPRPAETVGDFIGLTRQQASDLARKNALEPRFSGSPGEGDRIVDQSPGAGEPVARPAQIALTLAAAPTPSPKIGLIAAAFAGGLGVASLAAWALRGRPDIHKPQPIPDVRVEYQADPGIQSVRYRLEKGDAPRSVQLPPRPPREPADV